jgi:cob(I)alamin adenosyltransferase
MDVSSSSDEIKRFRVYTRTGDSGSSSLYNGERRSKDDVVFEVLGEVDELNSFIGVAREFCLLQENLADVTEQLAEIQSRLLDAGSTIATPPSTSTEAQRNRAKFPSGQAELLETWIDKMDDQLPPLVNFILPSGGKAACHLHCARTVCRRAERKTVLLRREGDEDVFAPVQIYLNRLSDYLFVAARFAAMKNKSIEIVYKKATGLMERPLS